MCSCLVSNLPSTDFNNLMALSRHRVWERWEKWDSENDPRTTWADWLNAIAHGNSIGNTDFLSTHPAHGKRMKVRLITLCVLCASSFVIQAD